MSTRKNIILIVSCLAIFFEALDVSVLNMAIPQMKQHFHFGDDAIQWVQTVYVLCYGGFVLLGGRLADIWGKKQMFLIGAALFMIASLGAGLTKQYSWLLCCRGLQGAGAALAIPAAIALITFTFTDPIEKNKALGIFGAMAAIGFATGLATGGVLSSYAGWQWVFFINVPIILGVLMLGIFYIPADTNHAPAAGNNIISGILLTTIMILIAYLVHALGTIGSHYKSYLPLLITTIVLAYYFIRRERKHPAPLIDFHLFRLKSVIIGNSGAILLGIVFMSYVFLLSLFLQESLHYSARDAGVLLFPFSILSALVSKFLLPRLFHRLGVTGTAIAGNIGMLTGIICFILATIGFYPYFFIYAAILSINSLGMAIAFPCLTILSVQDVPEQQHGLAAGVNVTGNAMGGGLGLALVSLMTQTNLLGGSPYLPALLVLAIMAAMGVILVTVAREPRQHTAIPAH